MEIYERCELVAKNREIIFKVFRLENAFIVNSAAIMFALENILVDVEKLKECKNLLKIKTKMFSPLRGLNKILLITKMYLSSNAEEYLDKIDQIYLLLNELKWSNQDFKVLTSMIIYEASTQDEYHTYVDKTINIYNLMKKNHGFLTSAEDLPFAAMLSQINKDENELIDEMESNFNYLKKDVFNKNSLQMLSATLVLYKGEYSKKCDKVMSLFEEFKRLECKFGANYELSMLAVLSSLDIENYEIVHKISQIEDILKEQKGFSSFYLNSTLRRLYASQIFMQDEQIKEKLSQSVLMSSNLALALQMQNISLICAVSVSTMMISNSN